MDDEINYLKRFNLETKELESVDVRGNQIREIFSIAVGDGTSFDELVDRLNEVRERSAKVDYYFEAAPVYDSFSGIGRDEVPDVLEITAWREMTSEEIVWRDKELILKKRLRSKDVEI
jgi:hypothetical protein